MRFSARSEHSNQTFRLSNLNSIIEFIESIESFQRNSIIESIEYIESFDLSNRSLQKLTKTLIWLVLVSTMQCFVTLTVCCLDSLGYKLAGFLDIEGHVSKYHTTVYYDNTKILKTNNALEFEFGLCEPTEPSEINVLICCSTS